MAFCALKYLLTVWLIFCADGGYTQDGTLIFENKKFNFFKQKASFALASSFCQFANSSLATIKESRLQQEIDDMLDDLNSNVQQLTRDEAYIGYWVGGTRQADNWTWFWTDGDVIPLPSLNSSGYSNWKNFEPNTADNHESCLALSPSKPSGLNGERGRWHGDACSVFQYFICQQELTPERQYKESESWIFLLAVIALLLMATLLLSGAILRMHSRLRSLRSQLSENGSSSNNIPNPPNEYEMACTPVSPTNSFLTPPEWKERPRGESNLYMEVDGSGMNHAEWSRSSQRSSHYVVMRPSSLEC